MRIIPIVLLMLSATPMVAQFVSTPWDARSCSMGGCSFENDNRRYVSLSHRQGFAVSGLSTQRLGVGWTVGAQGWVTTDYIFFGDVDYSEQQVVAGGGMRIDECLDLGVEARYCRVGTGDGYYEPERWMAMAARATVRVNSKLTLSALAGSRPWDSNRPWRMHVNAVFVPSSGLLAVVELESEERLRLRCGAEYGYREHFFFRAGMATYPITLTFGFGLQYEHYRIDLAAEAHNTLGITPQISMSLCL